MKRAIINSNVIDVQTGRVQKNATVFWIDGMLKEVGQHVDLPSDVTVTDAKGRFVTPGLINSFTHLGLKETGVRWEGNDANEASAAIHPDLMAVDGIYPFDKEFTQAVKTGITTVHVSPGPENVISGITAIIKPIGTAVDCMCVQANHGLAVSLGENPKKAHSSKKRSPYTRMKIASLIREQLRKAIYTKSSEENENNIFHRLLHKTATMYIQAHRLDDLMTAIRLKEEFDIHVVIVHATDAYGITDKLKKSNTPVLVGPFLTSKMRYEMKSLHPRTSVTLNDAEIPLAFVTPIVRNLPFEGALAMREGMSFRDALYAMTKGAANILGISKSVGTIEPGKQADLVIWEDEPLELQTTVNETIINGSTVYKKGVSSDESY